MLKFGLLLIAANIFGAQPAARNWFGEKGLNCRDQSPGTWGSDQRKVADHRRQLLGKQTQALE